jgi:hypothetical protein
MGSIESARYSEQGNLVEEHGPVCSCENEDDDQLRTYSDFMIGLIC